MVTEDCCAVCGKKVNRLTKTKIKDDIVVCTNCIGAVPFKEQMKRGNKDFTVDEIKHHIEKKAAEKDAAALKKKEKPDQPVLDAPPDKLKKEKKEKKIKEKPIKKQKKRDANIEFTPTQEIGTYLYVDEDSRKIAIPNTMSGKLNKKSKILEYDDILSFELLENGDTVTSGGLGRAAAGGILFGGSGAIVGAITGGGETSSNLRIKINLKNMSDLVAYITFYEYTLKKKSLLYKEAYDRAQECLSILQLICDDQNDSTPINAADELKKYKELLDMEAISQEEYEVKKKELL